MHLLFTLRVLFFRGERSKVRNVNGRGDRSLTSIDERDERKMNGKFQELLCTAKCKRKQKQIRKYPEAAHWQGLILATPAQRRFARI